MMFDRTQEARLRAERFGKTLDELCAQLAPWPEEAAAVQELRDAYTRKSRTFFEEEHLFSLAVIGQVKAGKSTFLNALLFGGQSLLPQAASPKTAVLTRLEYAPETSLTVEYYTEEDWELLRRSAAVPLESPTARGAGQDPGALPKAWRKNGCAVPPRAPRFSPAPARMPWPNCWKTPLAAGESGPPL